MIPSKTKAPLYLVMGLLFGLMVGLNIQGLWPNIPLHATATQGVDKFAIATGMVKNGVEAIYFLDFLTGDLRAAVLNPKTGQFNSRFTYNIASDFENAGRKSRYLMVTGLTQIPRGRSGYQFADSSVYVAEASTGKVAVYTIPWNPGMQAAGKPQSGPLVPLGVIQMRTAFVRDEQ
ncbi:MAG: hypothetical protein MK161_08120 [Pirellulales bacterium]|jgi:hypothetical protein|nr:hypothetical protein [Pirellulales bacterium]